MQVITGILILVLTLANTCNSKARPTQSENLIIEAIVEKIGESPGGASGFHAVYQLAKYRVTFVCEGDYNQPKIVIDHLLLDGNELDGLHIGDKVRLSVRRSKTIFVRNDEEGFRQAVDRIDYFYIGEKPSIISSQCESCKPCP